MQEIFKNISELFVAFCEDAEAFVEKQNKTAGRRARVTSLEIEKALKEFRKASMKE